MCINIAAIAWRPLPARPKHICVYHPLADRDAQGDAVSGSLMQAATAHWLHGMGVDSRLRACTFRPGPAIRPAPVGAQAVSMVACNSSRARHPGREWS